MKLKVRNSLFVSATLTLILCLSQQALCVGDRRPVLNCVFPPGVFLHEGKGGRILDVTKPPFNAKGDGKSDDTAALVKAYDQVLAEMDKYPWNPAGPQSPLCEHIIYLPNGTYLVSDTIIYSGPWRQYDKKVKGGKGGARIFERLVRIRFLGQERDSTIIRLKDNCPGFSQAPKAVVSFGRADLNNAVAHNAFRNITINTGSGNPAAIGLDFCGANNSGIRNVSVISGDGKGVAGIDIRISPSMGFHEDITVAGFDYGVRMTPYHMTHNCFEHATLRDQNKAGVQLNECSASLRQIYSLNRVPALQITTIAAQAVVLNSRFEGHDKSAPAIEVRQGHLFVRQVETPGYQAAIREQAKVTVSSQKIDEYVNGPAQTLREGQVKKSLNLPVEETPVVPWEPDFSKWANVDAYGAKGDGKTDDSAAVQAALDSGKPVVCFPKAVYKLGAPLRVPATVQRLTAFYGSVNGQIRVSADSPVPLLLEDFGTSSGTVIRHQVPRTLVLSHLHGNYYNENVTPGAKVFINNCNALGKTDKVFKNGRFWVRFMNTEWKESPNFTCNHSDMWVFGYKVEGRMTNFEAINGGRLEVLGGICNEHGANFSPEIPVLRNRDSSLCFIGLSNGPNKFDTVVEETLNGKTKKLLLKDCPQRNPGGKLGSGWDNDFVIPIYMSYEP